MAIGEEQDGVAMHLPEAAQVLMGRLRQRDEAVLVALGVSHMHAPTRGVDVADFKAQSFTQAQSRLYSVKKNTW